MPFILAHAAGNNATQGWWDVLMLWSWTDPTLIVLALAGWLYYRGLQNWPHPRTIRPWAPWAFYAGLAFMFLALASPIDVLADDLFFMHMVQHLIVGMVGPPLLLLGAPTTPLLRGLSRGLRRNMVAPLMRSREVRTFYRALAFPLTVWALYTFTIWAWHYVDGAYEAAIRHALLHLFQHFTFVFTAMLFWWIVIDPKPLRSVLPYWLRLIFMVVTVAQNIALGAAITFQDRLLYPYYAGRGSPWGIGPLYDQQIAGLIMWVMGAMMFMVAVVVIVGVWLEKEEKHSRESEAREDAALGLGT